METKGAIGAQGSYDLAVANGQVTVTVGYTGADLGASVVVNIPIKVYLDKLAAALPGLPADVIKGLETALGLS